jgi:hypothetical protein
MSGIIGVFVLPIFTNQPLAHAPFNALHNLQFTIVSPYWRDFSPLRVRRYVNRVHAAIEIESQNSIAFSVVEYSTFCSTSFINVKTLSFPSAWNPNQKVHRY